MSHAHSTGRRRDRAGHDLTALVAVALLASTSAAHANATPEQICQSGRANAAAPYTSCAAKAVAKFDLPPGNLGAYVRAAGKCVTKHAGTWAKLRKKVRGSGATFDSPRFVDNGDGTVTDRLTALQWEKKDNLDGTPNPADPHDADNGFGWSSGGPAWAADGTAFTSFLAAMNTGGCFAGQCDWRLPTRDELLTIVKPAYPRCNPEHPPLPPPFPPQTPCIDPTFGPTVAESYWSATPVAPTPFFTCGGSVGSLCSAWSVSFRGGSS